MISKAVINERFSSPPIDFIASFILSNSRFSSLRRSALSQKAKISVSQAENDLKETKERILIEVKAADNEYQLAIENYFTNKHNLSIFDFKIINGKTEVGVGPSFNYSNGRFAWIFNSENFVNVSNTYSRTKHLPGMK